MRQSVVRDSLGSAVAEEKSGSTYPKQLVDECILLFKEEHGVTLSEQEAFLILERLGGLFLAFAEPNTHKTYGG